jgi:multisubunit Na+/H+ antiporter MnhG subunit
VPGAGAAAIRTPDRALPELAAVHWRSRATDRSLTRAARLWTLATAAHTLPFIGVAALLPVLSLLTAPVALIALVHAWFIADLYAARGAGVARARPRPDTGAERTALGLLGDLVDHRARELHARTGFVLERGELGVWLLGEAGAVLTRPRARRVHCYCVKVPEAELPPSDRVAHLLLALRTDESGFATVANLAFSGARWRLRLRLAGPAREALDAAAAQARALERTGRAAQAS